MVEEILWASRAEHGRERGRDPRSLRSSKMGIERASPAFGGIP
jgi:hypothetical protein